MSDLFFNYIAENSDPERWSVYGKLAYPKRYHRHNYQQLPNVNHQTNLTIDEVLKKRCSSRTFSGKAVSLQLLAELLETALRRTRKDCAVFSPYPSGGALYPLEIYFLANNVKGLEPGLYHYHAEKHEIAQLKAVHLSLELQTQYFGEHLKTVAPLIFLHTYSKHRNVQKYGARGYLLAILEAGHQAQNLCLVASSTGLGSCCLCPIRYKLLNELLEVDGHTEHYLYTVAVGYTNEA